MTKPAKVPAWMMELGDIVMTMHTMTEEEADALGIPPEERHNYTRLDRVKGPENDTPPKAKP